MKRLWCWICGKFSTSAEKPSEIMRARQLIAAIDAGGIPLDPRRVVRIAEDLGLEVSRREPIGITIERIRAAVGRF
jgi:hypothetical protein